MKISIIEYPSCTWTLEGDSFFCSHDETEVVVYSDDRFGPNGHYEVEFKGYVCIDCGEPLEGDPDEDKQDLEAEIQLMNFLGK